MIPKGWQEKELSEVCIFKSGGTPNKSIPKYWDGDIPWITAKDMKSLELSDSLLKITEEGANNGTSLIEKDALLVLVRGMTLKKEVPICITTRRMAFNQDIKALVAKGIEPRYLAYYLMSQSNKIRSMVDEAGHGTGRLQTDLLGTFPVLLPSKEEQLHFVAIINLWEQLAVHYKRLLEKKILLNNGMKQQTLSGKRRIHGFVKIWRVRTIGDFLTESRLPGGDGTNANKITVKLYGLGVCEKNDKRQGSVNTKYYIRSSGQFIYSKLDFLNGAFGIIPDELDGYQSTLDLPCFDVAEGLSAKFLLYLVSQESFYSRFITSAAGGRKARRVNPEEFLATKIMLPEIKEQEAIVRVLDLMEREIFLLNKKLIALQQQRQGLMQQLLTGQLAIGKKSRSSTARKSA